MYWVHGPWCLPLKGSQKEGDVKGLISPETRANVANSAGGALSQQEHTKLSSSKSDLWPLKESQHWLLQMTGSPELHQVRGFTSPST